MKISITARLFIAGSICFLLVFFVPNRTSLLVLFGGVIWDAAFFMVLAEIDKKRAPVWTRGGGIRYQESPITYRLAYGLLVFLGLFFLIVLLSFTVFGRSECRLFV